MTRIMYSATMMKKELSRQDDLDAGNCSGGDQGDLEGEVCRKEKDAPVVQVDVTIEETRR